jgi:hypothetical protein
VKRFERRFFAVAWPRIGLRSFPLRSMLIASLLK